MLYDFESGYSGNVKKPKIVRKDSFLDAIQRKLAAVVLREEKTRVFTMQDAKNYFLQMRQSHPQACGSLIHVESQSRGYEIIQLLLDGSGEPLANTTKELVGRKVYAKTMEQAVVDCLGQESGFVMTCDVPAEKP